MPSTRAKRAERGDYEIDLTGHYVLPGFVDTHAHLHSLAHEQKVPAEYVLKLWMAHGVTSVREVGTHRPIEWIVGIKQRSARNEIVAPRIDVYPFFHEILDTPINDAQSARHAIREAKRRGADGIKFMSGEEDALFAALDEAEKLGLRTTMHHSQPRRRLCQRSADCSARARLHGALVRPAGSDVRGSRRPGLAGLVREQRRADAFRRGGAAVAPGGARRARRPGTR